MTLQTLLLHGEQMGRDQLVKEITKLVRPDPDEVDSWAMGLFQGDDEDCLTRQFLAVGSLKDCADAVAGCLTRKRNGSRLRLLFAQGEMPMIECTANDVCF